MRGDEVRDALVAKIQAITPDSKAHGGDLFRVIDAGQESLPVDRQCYLERSRPQEPSGTLFAGADPYRIGFDLAIGYVATPELSDRILKDGDKVVDAIKELESDAASYQQIHHVDIKGLSDSIDSSGIRVCSWSIEVIYDRRDPS